MDHFELGARLMLTETLLQFLVAGNYQADPDAAKHIAALQQHVLGHIGASCAAMNTADRAEFFPNVAVVTQQFFGRVQSLHTAIQAAQRAGAFPEESPPAAPDQSLKGATE